MTARFHLFQEEFGKEFPMPAAVLELLASGELIDVSWHNDVTPSFEHRDAPSSTGLYDLRLWIHPERIEDREFPESPRFNVCNQDADFLIETDDIGLAIEALRAAVAKITTNPATNPPPNTLSAILPTEWRERFKDEREILLLPPDSHCGTVIAKLIAVAELLITEMNGEREPIEMVRAAVVRTAAVILHG